jgi:hypothetical protein
MSEPSIEGNWELVEEDALSDTFRLPVPGGWLYRHCQYRPITGVRGGEDMETTAMAVAFVPAPKT